MPKQATIVPRSSRDDAIRAIVSQYEDDQLVAAIRKDMERAGIL